MLGEADRRGITPLFTSNMTPYGDIQLDTSRRLSLGAGSTSLDTSVAVDGEE